MAEPATMNMTNQMILLLVCGGGILIGAFLFLSVLISMLNYQETPIRDRLLLLKARGEFEKRGHQSAGPFDELKEAIITYSGPISQRLYGTNVKMQKEVKQLLTEAGLPDSEEHMWQVLTNIVAIGLVVGIVLGFSGLIIFKFNLTMGLSGLLTGIVLSPIFYKMMLRSKAATRKTEIRYTLPDTLDLMIVCVEAGLALDATIKRVADETEQMAPDISQEFQRLNKELNAGIARMEAFQNMGVRAGVEELRSLCAMIIQADKMGTSVSDTLRVYADDLRTKRRQKAEELAAKASIKMTFPLVFCIFPPLFGVLLGPMFIQMIQQLAPQIFEQFPFLK